MNRAEYRIKELRRMARCLDSDASVEQQFAQTLAELRYRQEYVDARRANAARLRKATTLVEQAADLLAEVMPQHTTGAAL